MKDIIAFVGVRLNSKRVKNKNIKPFSNTTLLEHKLKILKSVGEIRKIVVSSDSDKMLEIASKYDVSLHKRDEYHSSDKCTNSEYFKKIGEIVDGENIMYSPVTSPFVSRKTYSHCINLFQSCDNVVTTSMIKHHLWLDNNPLNYDIQNSPNSQNLPNIHAINYGCCLISRENILRYKNIVTNKPNFVVLDGVEGIDIDTELDFEFAEFILNKRINYVQ